VAVLVMAAVPFVRWVMTPSYGVLYAGVPEAELATLLGELDATGVPYELDGSRIMVPQDRLHTVRANLAQAGVSASPNVPGYELLDDQALGTSDLRQRVDLQRAIEGELARTLGAMDAIDTASVRLVIPEDRLFTDTQEPATASVLVRPARQLDNGEVEAITLLVSSAVEGLSPDQITVADTSGRVLHAPGDGSTIGGVTDRQQRRTQEFERRLASELSTLLERATNAPASVVVRADLDFDEVETQTDTYDPEDTGGIALREATSVELYEGAAAPMGGIVGVDGGPLGGGGEGSYEKDEATREFGVDRVTTRVVRAPGSVEGLSVALVVDEASPVPDGQLRELVTAAAGLDLERGDAVAISRVVIPALEELPEETGGMMDLVKQIVALLVLVVVAVGLFLMSRARRREAEPERVVPAAVRAPLALAEPELEELTAPGPPTLQDEVAELVERQPEEIATLLRGWLADRRTVAR
jgi:flagellar M-ring protein FliF